MSDLPDPLNAGEAVVREAEAVYPRNSWLGLGYRPVFGRLCLTNTRLIFQGTTLEQTLVFPLCCVVSARPTSRTIRTGKASEAGLAAFTQRSTLMVIEFDDGGREYFAVKDLAGWTQGILAARTAAPPMDYVTFPNRRPGVETTFGQIVLRVSSAALAVCLGLACCSALLLVSPSLLALLNGGGR